jgi:hypothetical protein
MPLLTCEGFGGFEEWEEEEAEVESPNPVRIKALA